MIAYRRWRIVAASTIGTSHSKCGTPCQDANVVKVFIDKDGEEVLVVVVSDGAGSAANAEIGSRLTCKTIVDAVELYLINGGKVDSINRSIAWSWCMMVQQAVKLQSEIDDRVPRDYACTMLVAIVAGNEAAFLQIGDGAIVISDGKEWCWVYWPQHGEFANMTNFVTEPWAEEVFAFEQCPRKIEEFAVFSDGLERLVLHEATKTVFAPFFDKMFSTVRAIEGEGVDTKLSEDLAVYLDSRIINDKTDDDKTLVLATRRPLLPAEFHENEKTP
jgi:hypothetical protein